MNAKGSKLRVLRGLPRKTLVIVGRKHEPTSSDKNSPPSNNTALYAVSRNSSTKRLSLLIKESKRSLESLQRSEEKLRQFNHQLSCISQSTCSAIGDDFFNNLAQSLASVFGVRYVIIGKGTTGKKIKTLAFWDGSKIAENFIYDLEGTPCEKVMSNNVHHFPHSAQEHFPNAPFLAEHDIESYLGVPIFDAERQLVGLLSVMDEKPITHYDHYSSILDIFAARCGSEIERMDAETRLESKAQELKKKQSSPQGFYIHRLP